jgi:hypothetical protein
MHLGTERGASFKIIISQYVSLLIRAQEQNTKQLEATRVE